MFFYLSKIVWFIVQPSSLILLGLLVGALLVTRGRAYVGRRCMLGSVATLVLIVLSPLTDGLLYHLETRFPRAQIDGRAIAAIVVLGGAEDSSGDGRELMGLNEAAERMTEAAALARRLPAATLFFSGGSGAMIGPHSQGARDAAALFGALGVEPTRIRLEDRSRTTFENAMFTRDLLPPQPHRPIVLVTSAWHMPRAAGVFQAAGYDVLAWPVDYRGPDRIRLLRLPGSVADGLRRLDGVVREYIGLLGYRLTGRTSRLFPAASAMPL